MSFRAPPIRIQRLATALTFALAFSFFAHARPNILFIMSDDHTWQAIGSYGSHLKEVAPTRNIDRLADEGMLLKNVFCTNSICTPSRATILSGQYSHRNGVLTLADNWNRDHHPNLAVEMQKAGYETAIIGKWHLHSQPVGFDYYKVLPGQGLYFNPLLKEIGKPWQDANEGGEPHEGHSSDVIGSETLAWLKEKRSPDKPFFLMCHFKAPHGLWEYNASASKTYMKASTYPSPTAYLRIPPIDLKDRGHTAAHLAQPIRYAIESSACRQKTWPTGTLDISGMDEKEQTRAAYQKYLKDYLRCVAGIDENVGRILDYLDEAGLTDDTLVVYTGDQGMMLGEHDRVDKRWAFEESMRMPFIARYPREIEANSINKDIINNTDFAPTFLEFAGRRSPKEMQGRSFRANLKGRTPRDWRDATYYRYWMHRAHHDTPAHYAIRTDRYKLVFYYGLPVHPAINAIASGETETVTEANMHMISSWEISKAQPTPAGLELYDLEKDPYEQNNVYLNSTYDKVAEELKSRLLQYKQDIGDLDEPFSKLMERRDAVWGN